MEFREIKIEDRDWIRELVEYSDFKGSGYSFALMLLWQDSYQTMVGRYKDFVIFRSVMEDGSYVYSMPAGKGNMDEALSEIENDAEKNGYQLCLYGVEDSAKCWLKVNRPGEFTYEPLRDVWDYVYNREDLATLKGKKYSSKRNHINRFTETDDWEYQQMSDLNMKDCLEMADIWYDDAVAKGNKSVIDEKKVLDKAIKYFNKLELTGGVLYKAGKLVAFTIGEALDKETYHVLIEKAYSDVHGAYPMINQQYVLHEMQNFRYVNREEDTGLPGLRKAKESYHPAFMIEKCLARKKY